MIWDDARDALLKQKHAEGLPFSVIAADIPGTTKNSCIGRARRLGLPIRETGRAPCEVHVPGRQHRPRRRRIIGAAANALYRKIHDARPKVPELPANESEYAVPFMQAVDCQCRWPLGEPSAKMLVCGAPTFDELSYCARHALIAYRPAEKLEPEFVEREAA